MDLIIYLIVRCWFTPHVASLGCKGTPTHTHISFGVDSISLFTVKITSCQLFPNIWDTSGIVLVRVKSIRCPLRITLLTSTKPIKQAKSYFIHIQQLIPHSVMLYVILIQRNHHVPIISCYHRGLVSSSKNFPLFFHILLSHVPSLFGFFLSFFHSYRFA